MLSTLGPAASSPTSGASPLELPRELRGIAQEGRRLLDGIFVLGLTPVEALIACRGDDTWFAHQLLDHVFLPGCRMRRVLMEEVPPIPHLLAIELNTEGKMLNCSAFLGRNRHRVTDQVVYPLPRGKGRTHG